VAKLSRPAGLANFKMNYNQKTTETIYHYDAGVIASTTALTTYGYFDITYLVLKMALGLAVILLLIKRK